MSAPATIQPSERRWAAPRTNVAAVFSPRTAGGSRSAEIPIPSPLLLTWFTWYARRYLRRHFNSLRVSVEGLPPAPSSRPTVVYSNHASWWDPLVGLIVTRTLLPEKRVFAPMEAAALGRYGFFRRLGVFGVELGTLRGAANFRRQAASILSDSRNLLWLTPQARFADARERPLSLKPGLGHLPGLAAEVCFLPVAIEYVFWEERLPEILVRFGDACATSHPDRSVGSKAWLDYFSRSLAQTQDALAAESVRREAGAFRCLLRGQAGVGGPYDFWRKWRARWRGNRFTPQHSGL